MWEMKSRAIDRKISLLLMGKEQVTSPKTHQAIRWWWQGSVSFMEETKKQLLPHPIPMDHSTVNTLGYITSHARVSGRLVPDLRSQKLQSVTAQ